MIFCHFSHFGLGMAVFHPKVPPPKSGRNCSVFNNFPLVGTATKNETSEWFWGHFLTPNHAPWDRGPEQPKTAPEGQPWGQNSGPGVRLGHPEVRIRTGVGDWSPVVSPHPTPPGLTGCYCAMALQIFAAETEAILLHPNIVQSSSFPT